MCYILPYRYTLYMIVVLLSGRVETRYTTKYFEVRRGGGGLARKSALAFWRNYSKETPPSLPPFSFFFRTFGAAARSPSSVFTSAGLRTYFMFRIPYSMLNVPIYHSPHCMLTNAPYFDFCHFPRSICIYICPCSTFHFFMLLVHSLFLYLQYIPCGVSSSRQPRSLPPPFYFVELPRLTEHEYY